MPQAIVHRGVVAGREGDAEALAAKLRAQGMEAGIHGEAAERVLTLDRFVVDEGADAQEVANQIFDRTGLPWREFLYRPDPPTSA